MAVTVVLFALAMVEFRRPVPPKWVGFPLMEQVVVLTFTAAVATSGGLILKFVFNFKKEVFGVVEGGLIVAIIVAAFVVMRALKPMQRIRAFEAAEGGGAIGAANLMTAGAAGRPVNDPAKPKAPHRVA